MLSSDELLKKHSRTIYSRALRAIRDWALPNYATATDENDINGRISANEQEYADFFKESFVFIEKKIETQ
jgi:hypothetical protein